MLEAYSWYTLEAMEHGVWLSLMLIKFLGKHLVYGSICMRYIFGDVGTWLRYTIDSTFLMYPMVHGVWHDIWLRYIVGTWYGTCVDVHALVHIGKILTFYLRCYGQNWPYC
jgi:hypothetical protein